MRLRRCFTMLLAAVLALAITTARAMPTAVTVEAAPDDASTGAVTFSVDLLSMEGQVPKDGSQYGGSRYGAIEDTEPEHDVSTSTNVSASLPEAPTDDSDDGVLGRLATATEWSGYSSDSPSNLQTEPEVRSIGDSSRGHSQLSTLIPVTTVQTGTTETYLASISEDAISPSTYPTTAPAKGLLELSDTGNEGKPFGGSGMTTLGDVTSEQLSSTDLPIGKEDLVSRNKEAETPERERPPKSDDPNGMHENEPIGSGRTDRGRVPAVIVSARADEDGASSSDRANPLPQKGSIGSVAPALQASPAESAQSGSSGTAQVDHLMARAGEKPDMEKDAGGSDSPREDASKAGKNEKEAATLASAPAGVGDEPRQDTPGTRNLNTDPPAAARAANDPVHSSQPGNSPGQGARTSNKPTEGTEKLDASALSKASQAGLPELGRAEPPTPQQGPTGNGGKGDTVRTDDAASPKLGGGLSGRAADTTDKALEAPRNADTPTAGSTNKGNEPLSPRAEQPKATGGEPGAGAHPTNKSPEVPRSADAPVGGNNKANQPESPRAEQPKAGSGESGRGDEPSSKPAEVPRSADAPGGGINKASQPASPRAEQPKAGSGESGRGVDPSSKPAEVPRTADAPVGGNNKANQPESPRAEQPKAGSGESGRGDDPSSKPAEVPRSADAPGGGNNKASQPESPRAEQPKAGSGESGRGVDPSSKPAEVPRTADAPVGGNNKANQPESPRAEQPKAGSGVSGRGDDPSSKPAEVPRSADAPGGGNNKASQPESPRAEQPKAGSGESGRGDEPSSKPAEVPRSADAPGGGKNKASQPESPRAEQPKAGSGESGRGADPSSKPAEVPRSADAPVGGNNKASQLEIPRTEQSRPQQVQPLIDAGGKGDTARDGDAAKLKAGGGESVRGGETVNKPQEVPRNVDVPAGANKAGQPEAPRAEQPKAQGPGKASDSSEVPRAEQQNPPTVMKAVTNKNSEGREDRQPEIPKTEVPKLPAPSSAARDGKGDATPGKTQGTLRTDEGKTVVDVKGDPPVAVTVPEGSKTKVIVEDKKDSKEDIKKPEATKMVEATESETHISIDNHEPEKKPTAVVVQEERPHEGMKDKDKEAVLVIKNITVEVEPEAAKPDSKPEKTVPVVPPTETVVYPPPPVLSPPYQQSSAYQPYQPYQAPPYHQPSGTVVYIPQSVYQPAPHMTYVPGNMLPYQGQHMSPSYQPVQYQQPYTGYQQTAYHPVYQPTYHPVNGPAYPQAQHAAYNPAYMPSYRPQQQVIYVAQYQPPRANPSEHYITNQASHHVAYAPTYKGQHNPAPMAGYQAGYPPAANIPYAAPAYQNYPRYSPAVKPAYRTQREHVVHLRHIQPVVKRPGHRTLAHGGYRRNVNEQNHASQLHFAPVIAHKENAAVPIDAPALKTSPAAHPAALGPLQSYRAHSAGENPHFKASHPPKMTIWKGPIYDEPHIPVAYRRSGVPDEAPAVEDMELLEIYEDGDASVEQPINTESEFV
ncbi:mucin-19-like isoform X2 [Dermacentor albipictus]|uniref:mucin-19-like isoform X2 n=1 Tax=Dermacentor albipictus TaxID=60249 RepID=UPI0031FCC45D